MRQPCWETSWEAGNMAAAATPSLSHKVAELDSRSKDRYIEKINLVNGLDPYNIPKQEWSHDVTTWPKITYLDMVSYLVLSKSAYTMEQMKAHKSLEAYNQFVSGWVRDIWSYSASKDLSILSGRVMHSQRLRETPLHPWVISQNDGTILAAHCDCMAGLCECCTHVAALLFAVEASVRLQESKTVTQEKAYWVVPPVREVKYLPIADIDFTSAKTKKMKLDAAITKSTCTAMKSVPTHSPSTSTSRPISTEPVSVPTAQMSRPTTPVTGQTTSECRPTTPSNPTSRPATPVATGSSPVAGIPQSTRRPTTPTTSHKDKTNPPTQDELKVFFESLSSCHAQYKPALLSVVPPHSDTYVPQALSRKFPPLLTDLVNKDYTDLPYNDLLEACKNYQISVSEEEAANVEVATKEQAASKVWFRFRAGRITASRLRAACVTNPDMPSQSLIKAICYPDMVKFTSKATTWGCEHEKDAYAKYQTDITTQHNNCELTDSGFVIHPEYPHMGASPDGLVHCACCGDGCLEIKCPFCIKDDSITLQNIPSTFCLEERNGQLLLKRDHAYFYQVQAQIFLTKRDFCDFVVWTNTDFHYERILPDLQFWQDACVKATHFFQTAILPELLGNFYTRPAKMLTTDSSGDATSDNNAIQPQSKWCYCQKMKDNPLIPCSNEDCGIKKFHKECLMLKRVPNKNTKWYCPECRKLEKFKRSKKK